MALKIGVKQQERNTWVVSLDGALEAETAAAFGQRIQPLLETRGATMVLDMAGLDYISSAGLREIFKAQKVQRAVQGKLVFLHLQPQIRKVFDIVNALPSMSIFSSLQEMDAYLDNMQKQVTDPDGYDASK